ncbi:cyclic nucleotide-binding domain-containing protein [Shewanella chilikensis]|uniref:Cyclic nucleotide-binding domain-containing protein n=2 Tax=Shewanella chilikensis TaxID=558541 RepID=A0A6G7LPE3_9GAMM|nr:cyclic nucleotide-binding domain-containing protein [Shewanella chilikensis]
MQSKMRMSSINMIEKLKDPKYEGFLNDFRCKQYAKGQLVSIPGATCNDVFIVLSGRVRVYLSYEDREFTLCFLEPGDIFSTHTRAFLGATKESTLMLLSAKHFREKVIEFPEVSMIMTGVLGEVLGSTLDIVEGLIFHDARHRMLEFILSWGENSGIWSERGLAFKCDLSIEDISLLIGTTRQTASSLLNNFIRNGYLIKDGRKGFIISRYEDMKELFAKSF